jgi:hypothetical protein
MMITTHIKTLSIFSLFSKLECFNDLFWTNESMQMLSSVSSEAYSQKVYHFYFCDLEWSFLDPPYHDMSKSKQIQGED